VPQKHDSPFHLTHKPLQGASFMMLAGLAFAGVNTLTPYLAAELHMRSGWIAFYQYLIALACMLPWMLKQGLRQVMATRYFWRHFWRIVMAVIGIQLWVRALSIPIPIGQGLALLMASPLFATLGAVLYLKERVDTRRSLALILGFVGALIILNPWSERFSYVMLFPLMAAFFWACHSIMLKDLADKDSSITMVAYLYLLVTPFNLVLALTNNLSTLDNMTVQTPTASSAWLFVALGVLTALAQYFIARAYHAADAVFIQPFDYVKLPINVLLGFIFFGWGIDLVFVIGAGLIVGSSFFITHQESRAVKS
jgi:drug/metabolite transporter (DMT)-like permease